MKNYDESVEMIHKPNWLYSLEHPFRNLIIGGSGSGKTNVLLNLIKISEQMLAKFFYLSKIHSNQSINCLTKEEEN